MPFYGLQIYSTKDLESVIVEFDSAMKHVALWNQK
jgi:hypothetical protein